MQSKELEFYNNLKNWDFSQIKYEEENLTQWDMYDILRKNTNPQSKILGRFDGIIIKNTNT